ncbi:Proline-rich protein PRCC [Orchesella cincta]|uniref:Proline-rich protein PRCC n=1 Tax=Orchesella cincta TaxID=48709 RepID=A0A1D2MGM8_ORCCI|nr:Proline-rich protein PRCC [Orchesella cincta]
MSSLGLVAYDGSGSSSEDEDEPMSEATGSDQKGQLTKQVINGAPSSSLNPGGSNSATKSTVIFSKFIDDEEEDDEVIAENDGEQALVEGSVNDDANPIWSKFLPKPKKMPDEGTEDGQDVEIGPIPPKKTYGDEELPPPKQSTMSSLTATKVQGKVRISIPFLSSLDEEESGEGTEKKMLMNPAKKGSGLFALLPQPKNSMSIVSNMFAKDSTKTPEAQKTTDIPKQDTQSMSTSSVNRLIPDSVKNKLKRPAAASSEQLRAKYSKKSASATVTSANKKDSDGSDDEGAGDFFSLDSTEIADPEALEKLKLPMPDFTKQNIPTEEEMEVEDSNNQGYHQDAVPSSSRSEALMRFLQPRKARKEDVQMIDVSADDLKSDPTEWLRNITDESAAPARRGKGLGGMVKRKHQITYLAFEAKAREQELKNQWAVNRANKMATKNKYGF